MNNQGLSAHKELRGYDNSILALLDESVSHLGAEWDIILDYLTNHPFYNFKHQDLLPKYKKIIEEKSVYLYGDPLSYYNDPTH